LGNAEEEEKPGMPTTGKIKKPSGKTWGGERKEMGGVKCQKNSGGGNEREESTDSSY